MVTKDLNRLKLVLVEKKKTGVWLASGVAILLNPHYLQLIKLQNY